MWTEQQNNFWNQMWPLAQDASARTGISPDVIFAQSALETGWGLHAPNNNYFGIKGPGGTQSTREFQNGQWVTVNAPFRGYTSMADSVQGFVDFITGNPRYKGVPTAGDTTSQAMALQNAGYATDPNYASKLGGIMASIPAGLKNSLPQLPSLPSMEGINKWFIDHTGLPLDDPSGQMGGASDTVIQKGIGSGISDAVSGAISDTLSKLANPLKRTGFIVLAILLIIISIFLMSPKEVRETMVGGG